MGADRICATNTASSATSASKANERTRDRWRLPLRPRPRKRTLRAVGHLGAILPTSHIAT
jgi:hypothetical protein